MSAKQMGLVWEHEFNRAEQAVMLALADHADHDGSSIHPSISRISWKTGYSERHIRRTMSDLRERGILVIVREAEPDRHRPTEYRFNWSKAQPKKPFNPPDRGVSRVPPDTTSPPDTSVRGGGDSGDRSPPDIAVSPESSEQPSIQPSERDRAHGVIYPDIDSNPCPPGANIDDYDNELYEMETILQQVVRENPKYPTHFQRIREGAKALLHARHTPKEVAEGFGEGETYWYAVSHGRKGEKPWVSNVVGEIAAAVAWSGKSTAPTQAKSEIWNQEIRPYMCGEKDFANLSQTAQDAIRAIGESNVKDRPTKDVRIRFYEYMKAVSA